MLEQKTIQKTPSGSREIPFQKQSFIEREDFKEEANRKFFSLHW